jgi:hypothetical protein
MHPRRTRRALRRRRRHRGRQSGHHANRLVPYPPGEGPRPLVTSLVHDHPGQRRRSCRSNRCSRRWPRHRRGSSRVTRRWLRHRRGSSRVNRRWLRRRRGSSRVTHRWLRRHRGSRPMSRVVRLVVPFTRPARRVAASRQSLGLAWSRPPRPPGAVRAESGPRAPSSRSRSRHGPRRKWGPPSPTGSPRGRAKRIWTQLMACPRRT